MRINYTLVFAIILATGIVATAFTFFQISKERGRQSRTITERSAFIASGFQDEVGHQTITHDSAALANLAVRYSIKYHLYGIIYLEPPDHLVSSAKRAETFIQETGARHADPELKDSVTGLFIKSGGQYLHQYSRPLHPAGGVKGKIIILTDASYVPHELLGIWLRNVIRWILQALLVAGVTLLILRWGIFTPLEHLAHWMKATRTGSDQHLKTGLSLRFLAPLHHEARRMVEAMTEALATAEEEVRLRTTGEAVWTSLRLHAEANRILQNRLLVVVSNREPYMHIREGREIRYITPASGMVTAMEPILKACGGLWVASGTGDADRLVVDMNDKITVPPDDPKYTLRRVWTTPEEEEHYYYGFANEGLWPLCHVVHTRPVFRPDDWEYYQRVNRKFADIILEEIASEDDPYILVQDYHFALLPAMIKESRPDARVSLFWHIPWPNPESFGICPWQKEILAGMLGADLVGFHTQYHCNNFLSTVNVSLQSLVTWEKFTIKMGEHVTKVQPFPISISFTAKDNGNGPPEGHSVSALLKPYGISAQLIGVGVDRIDYTKGILERFLAIELFLKTHEAYRGKFTFVQIGAPSRTFIKSYSDLVVQVEREAERINKEFQSQGWKPILLLGRHHSHNEIAPFYRNAAFCMVTSLHDGMNLVAKEFVASRQDHSGVLILSKFTGAAQELSTALIVNPYDIGEMSEAIQTALEMPIGEQQQRMDQMRETILRHNIYSWAADLLKGMDSA